MLWLLTGTVITDDLEERVFLGGLTDGLLHSRDGHVFLEMDENDSNVQDRVMVAFPEARPIEGPLKMFFDTIDLRRDATQSVLHPKEPMAILFYRAQDPYGCFSNFSRHPVEIYGRLWMTSEHAFQAMKFHTSQAHMDLVFNAPTPGQAANLHGRNRSYPLRRDWDAFPNTKLLAKVEKVVLKFGQPIDGVNRRGVEAEPLFMRTKDIIMYEVCRAKFIQHQVLNKILLDTTDHVLIEDTTDDAYWGWGTSKIGENKLGRILMLIRSEFRA